MSTQTQGESVPEPAADRRSTPPERPRRALRLALPALVMLVVLGGLTALLVIPSSKPQLPGGVSSLHSASFDGALLEPIRPAPPLSTLHNDQGQPINLADYRGKAVFLSFLYTHCPDVCPLIAASLHTAYAQLGARASKVQLMAVSVDPRGDTRGSVAKFLQEHQLTGEMQYLIGSPHQLASVWGRWGVGSEQDVGDPQVVNHSALVYGISASGKVMTIYPSNFKPSQIVHDVSGLLGS